MKNSPWILLAALALASSLAFADMECGDDGTACGESERCCEHVISTFAGEHSTAAPYVQGQCIAKEQKCSEFWCGSRHCEGGFFGTPSVCCVNVNQGSATQYSCAYSELSCPGNTQQLTIREIQHTAGK